MNIAGGFRDSYDLLPQQQQQQQQQQQPSKQNPRTERERFPNKTLVSPQYAQQQQQNRLEARGQRGHKAPQSDQGGDWAIRGGQAPDRGFRGASGGGVGGEHGRDRDWDRSRPRDPSGEFQDRPRDKFRDDRFRDPAGAPPGAQGSIFIQIQIKISLFLFFFRKKLFF